MSISAWKSKLEKWSAQPAAKLHNWSEDYHKFLSSGKCPKCDHQIVKYFSREPIGARFYDANGKIEQLNPLANLAAQYLSTISEVECAFCSYRWPVRSPTPTINIVKIDRVEESLKEESRDYDNSQSSTPISDTLKFSQKWSKTFKIETENSSSVNREVKFGTKDEINFRKACEEKLRAAYSITDQQEEITEREISFEVPAHTKLMVVVMYTYTSERGYFEISRDKTVIRIPFQTRIGVNIRTQKREERVS